MSMFLVFGAVTVVILMAFNVSLAQTTPTVPVAVSGDADTGPDSVSVIFQSGELSPSGDLRFLLLSFKITVKIGKQYTNGATPWFSSDSLVLHTPKGDAIAPGTGYFYNDHCSSSCTITYTIPSDVPGVYTITNDYVGCCGTKHGQVTFTVPSWRANSKAVGLDYPNPSSKLEPGGGQTPSPQTLQPVTGQTPQVQVPQGGIPFPLPTGFGKKISDDHDLDGFKTFDALTKAQQVKKLTKKGPRLPLEYDMSDLSLRAFVKGGWPIVLDYRLESGAFAELSISVNGVTPLITKIDPAKRAQLRIAIPNDFGAKPQVAKLRITALTRKKEPAAFHLFGIAMGERGVQALWKVNAHNSEMQLAMNRSSVTPALDYEPLSLSTSNAPQTSSSIQISVADPTTIRPRQRPSLSFSARCQSNFNSGRWEVWHVGGLRRAVEVWQESTGSILPNKTKSGKWNGIKSGKQVSFGNHFVQLTAWYGRQSDRDWVVASTDSNLIVIR